MTSCEINRQNIEYWQNIANIVICSITTLNLLWTCITGTFHTFSLPFILTHFVVDIVFATPIIKFHHVLGILCFAVKYGCAMKPEDDWHILKNLYKTEISTFFYVFKLWTPKSATVLYWTNSALFAATFFKFRIYDFYNQIIANPTHYELMEKYIANSWVKAVGLYTSTYGLYALNMYWVVHIFRQAYKSAIKTLVTAKNALLIEHHAIALIQFAGMFAVCYVYSSSPNKSNIFDMLGIAIASSISCQYHSAVIKHYRLLDKIDYVAPELFEHFMMNQFATHFKSFLCAASAIYFVEDYRPIILFSAGLHLCAYFATTYRLHDMKRDGMEIMQYPHTEAYERITKTLTIVNYAVSLFDVMIVIAHSSDPVASIHLLNSTYLCGLLIAITPFYNLNPVAIQLCMLAQNIYLSQCNLRYSFDGLTDESNTVMQIVV